MAKQTNELPSLDDFKAAANGLPSLDEFESVLKKKESPIPLPGSSGEGDPYPSTASDSPSPDGTLSSPTRSVNTEPTLEASLQPAIPPQAAQAQPDAAVKESPVGTIDTATGSRMPQDVSSQPQAPETSYAQGFAKSFNRRLSDTFRLADYAVNKIQSTIGTTIFGEEFEPARKIMSDAGVISSPFTGAADLIDKANEGAADAPQNIAGKVVEGVGGILPDIMSAALMPEIKVGGWLAKYGVKGMDKFAMYLGGVEGTAAVQASEGGTPLEQMTAPLKGTAQGVTTGLLFNSFGTVAGKIGEKVAGKLISNPATYKEYLNKALTQGGTSTAANALMFGGYAGLEEFLQTGEVSADNVATNIGIGIALGAKDLGKLTFVRGLQSFIATPKSTISKVAQSKTTPEQMKAMSDENLAELNKAVEGLNQGEQPTADINKKAVDAAVNDNLANLKSFVDEVVSNPEKIVDAVKESELPEQAKVELIDKINEVAIDNHPKTIATAPIREEIKQLETQVEELNRVKSDSPVKTEKTKIIQDKIAELQGKVDEVMAEAPAVPERTTAQSVTPAAPENVGEMKAPERTTDVPQQSSQPTPDQGATEPTPPTEAVKPEGVIQRLNDISKVDTKTIEKLDRLSNNGRQGEWAVVADENGNIISRQLESDNGIISPNAGVDWEVDKPSVIIHTHPDNSIFSIEDIAMLWRGATKEIKVILPNGDVVSAKRIIPDGETYSDRVKQNRGTIPQIKKVWDEIENEIFDSGRSKDLTTEEIIQKINEEIAPKIGIEITKNKLTDYSEPWVKEIKTTNQGISEAYYKAKSDGSNPKLVKAIEELLPPKSDGTGSDKVSTPKLTPNETTKEGQQEGLLTTETAGAGQPAPAEPDPVVTAERTGAVITPNKEVSASAGKSIDDLLTQSKGYTDLTPMSAGMLYSKFKVGKEVEIPFEEGMQKTMLEKLKDMDYIEDYTSDGYTLTDKGQKFVDAVDARLETRRGVKAGTDLFPEMANIPEFKAKVEKIKQTEPISDETIKRIREQDPKELRQSATNIERQAESNKEAELVKAVEEADATISDGTGIKELLSEDNPNIQSASEFFDNYEKTVEKQPVKPTGIRMDKNGRVISTNEKLYTSKISKWNKKSDDAYFEYVTGKIKNGEKLSKNQLESYVSDLHSRGNIIEAEGLLKEYGYSKNENGKWVNPKQIANPTATKPTEPKQTTTDPPAAKTEPLTTATTVQDLQTRFADKAGTPEYNQKMEELRGQSRPGDFIRKAKFTKGMGDTNKLQSNPLGVATGVWDGIVESIATAVDASVAVSKAVRQAWEKAKKHINEAEWAEKEKALTDFVMGAYRENKVFERVANNTEQINKTGSTVRDNPFTNTDNYRKLSQLAKDLAEVGEVKLDQGIDNVVEKLVELIPDQKKYIEAVKDKLAIDLGLKTDIESGRKERQHYTQIQNREDLSQELKDALKSDEDTRTYLKRSNAIDLLEANTIIERIGLDKATKLVMDSETEMHAAVRTVLKGRVYEEWNRLGTAAYEMAGAERASYYFDEGAKVAESMIKEKTEEAQSLQATSLMSAPAKAMYDTQKEMNKQTKQKLEQDKESIDKKKKALKTANKESADEMLNKPDVKKKTKELNDKADKAQTPAEKLARAIIGRVKKVKPKEFDPINEMVKTLFGKVDEKLDPKQPSPKLSDIEKLKLALENKDEYSLTWEDAKDIVKEKIDKMQVSEVEKADMMNQLNNFYDEVIGKPFNERVMEGAVKQFSTDQGVDINDVIRQHYSVYDATRKSLAEKFVAELGLSDADALDAAKFFQQKFNEIAINKKRKALENQLTVKERLSSKKIKATHEALIELSNMGAFSDEQFANMYAQKMGIPVMTPEIAAKIQHLSDVVQESPSGWQRYEAVQNLMEYQASIKGIDWGDVATSMWYSGMLSGYKTQIKNIFSNTANTMMEFSRAAIKDPRKIPFLLVGLGKGHLEGLTVGSHVFLTGQFPLHYKLEVRNAMEQVKFKNGYKNPLNIGMAGFKAVPRFMTAADVFSYQGLSEMRAYELAWKIAYKEGLKNPFSKETWKKVNDLLYNQDITFESAQRKAEFELSGRTFRNSAEKAIATKRRVYEIMSEGRSPEIVEDTHTFASKGTFNAPTKGTLGMLADYVGMASNTPIALKVPFNGKTFTIRPGKLLVPFTRVIANVANTALDYTPVGFYRAAKGGIGFKSYEKLSGVGNKYEKFTHEKRTDALAKAIIGTGAMAAMIYLTQPDDETGESILSVTASGPDDLQKQNELRNSGWMPYSIKVGKRYISYQYTPLMLALAPLGYYRDKEKYNPEQIAGQEGFDIVMDNIGYAMLKSVTALSDLSFLGSLAGVMNIVSNKNEAEAEASLKRLVQSSMKSMVMPNIVNQLTADYQEYFSIPIKEANTIGKFMIKDIPVARNTINNKINELGDPVTKSTHIFFSKETDDPIRNFLVDNNVFIGKPSQKQAQILDMDGKTHRMMTDNEYYLFAQLRGKKIKDKVIELMNIKGLNREQIKKQIDDYKPIATTYAKNITEDVVNKTMYNSEEYKNLIKILKDRGVDIPPDK